MKTAIASLCCMLALGAAQAADGADSPVLQRRAALYKLAAKGPGSTGALAAALADENGIIRRAAARLLLDMGPAARQALVDALGNDDLVVRRTALKGVSRLLGPEALPYLAKAMADPNESVRQLAIGRLIGLKPRSDAVVKLLENARKDKSRTIRAMATRALWPFHKDTVLIRERTDYDHLVTLVKAIRLPKDGWRFTLDRSRAGHLKKWFEPGFDDSKWKTIAIEQAWQKAGYDYTGVTWYRRTIELPARPEHVAAEIHFDGVDECAWVWVNGQYVGQHDIGPNGWNIPFGLDITSAVKWGQKNQITVRAMNTAHAGGIWRPVRIEILK